MGVTTYYAGGALGFDSLAAEAVIEQRKKYPSISLVLVIPCRDKAARWSAGDKAKYEQLKEDANEVICLAEHYFRGCMHQRNRYMVDHSAYCICYLTEPTGGTDYTVRYARDKKLRIFNLAIPNQVTTSTKVTKMDNHTLYARWTAATNTAYTVEHYQQTTNRDGYALKETESKTGTTAAQTAASAKTYTGFTAQSITQQTIAADGSTVVKVYYDRNSYTVSFDANYTGAATIPDITVYYGGYYGELPTPTRAGYGFDGWYTDATNGDQVTGFNTVAITAAQTLYAHWTPSSYTVTLHTDGGVVRSNNVTSYTAGTAKALPAVGDMEKSGYTFEGWYTDSGTSGTKVSSIPADTTGDKTYYAKWTKNKYTVTIIADAGVTVTPDTTGEEYEYGAVVTLSRSENTGYHFTSWTVTEPAAGLALTENGTSVSFVMPADNVKIKANAAANTYTVVFHPNDGTGFMASQSMTIGTAANLKANDFTRTGYTFSGWNAQANGTGTAYGEGANITNTVGSSATALTTTDGGTVTLYAQWNPISYTVTYDANGGGTVAAASGKHYGDTITLPTTAKTGHTLTGWKVTDGATYAPGASYTVTGNVTLTAQWTINTYTVTYYVDGAVYQTKTVDYNTAFSAASPALAKTGYSFKGWYTAETDGTAVTGNITTDTPVYAQWTVNQYTVSLPTGASGYTAAVASGGSLTADYGGSVSFTVTVADHYDATNMKVYANGNRREQQCLQLHRQQHRSEYHHHG